MLTYLHRALRVNGSLDKEGTVVRAALSSADARSQCKSVAISSKPAGLGASMSFTMQGDSSLSKRWVTHVLDARRLSHYPQSQASCDFPKRTAEEGKLRLPPRLPTYYRSLRDRRLPQTGVCASRPLKSPATRERSTRLSALPSPRRRMDLRARVSGTSWATFLLIYGYPSR